MELKEGMKVRVLRSVYREIPADTVTHIVEPFDDGASLWCETIPDGLYFYRDEFEPLPVADATEEEATLKIEKGKYYRTRDGRKVGPAVPNHIAPISYPWNIPYRGAYHAYCVDGSSCVDDKDDVVAEWQDEPTIVADQSAPASTNDNQASATLNFNTTDANAKLDEIIAKLKLIDEMASELGISFTTQQAA